MDSTHCLSNSGDQAEKEVSDDQTGYCEQSHGLRAQDETGAKKVAEASVVLNKTSSPQGPITAWELSSACTVVLGDDFDQHLVDEDHVILLEALMMPNGL